MTYLAYIAVFGAVTAIFLWLRDIRIFYRTALPGYRKASWHGIGYSSLATLGSAVAIFWLEVLGLGLILCALYLQGRIDRERVWSNEGPLERFLGSVPLRVANKK